MLPIFGDLRAIWALTLEGQLVEILHEYPGLTPVQPSRTQRLRIHQALMQGAIKFPALAPYFPQRTADDQACPLCAKGGIGEKFAGTSACWCGGSGWLPEGVSQNIKLGREVLENRE